MTREQLADALLGNYLFLMFGIALIVLGLCALHDWSVEGETKRRDLLDGEIARDGLASVLRRRWRVR